MLVRRTLKCAIIQYMREEQRRNEKIKTIAGGSACAQHCTEHACVHGDSRGKTAADAQKDTKTCRQYHDSRTIGRLARERRKQFFTWLPGRIRKQLVRWLVTGF